MAIDKITQLVSTSTEGTKLASGTTAQRGSTAGQVRLNTTLGRFEGTTDGSAFIALGTVPSITSFSPSTLSSAGGETVVITGTGFAVGLTTVTLNGTAPSSITVNSTTQITIAGTPAKSAATYTDGMVVTVDGVQATASFSTSGLPAFTTAAGSLGSFQEQTSVGTLVGGSDVGTSHVVTTGSLPSGLSIASASGNITGTIGANTNTASIPENGTGDVTSTFTITATDAESQTSTRQFTIGNKQGDPVFGNTYFANTGGTPTTNLGGASDKGSATIGNAGIISSHSSIKKFGSDAVLFNGTGAAAHLDVAVPADRAFNESNANYLCFEGWGYLSNNTGNLTWGSSTSYGNQGFLAAGDTYMSISIDGSGRVGFYQYNSSSSADYRGQWATTGNISTGAWFHFLFQTSPTDIKYWKDGTYIGSVGRVANNSGTPHQYRIGGSLNNTGSRNWDGAFDELRLTVSGSSADARATGTGNITVPTEGLRLYTT
tara:strand:+ start:140 stop:1603 length:1464 start_codon:yes stop_codon:yes gene_type:complete